MWTFYFLVSHLLFSLFFFISLFKFVMPRITEQAMWPMSQWSSDFAQYKQQWCNPWTKLHSLFWVNQIFAEFSSTLMWMSWCRNTKGLFLINSTPKLNLPLVKKSKSLSHCDQLRYYFELKQSRFGKNCRPTKENCFQYLSTNG